jgi:hypothetical protein
MLMRKALNGPQGITPQETTSSGHQDELIADQWSVIVSHMKFKQYTYFESARRSRVDVFGGVPAPPSRAGVGVRLGQKRAVRLRLADLPGASTKRASGLA